MTVLISVDITEDVVALVSGNFRGALGMLVQTRKLYRGGY